MHKGGLFSSLQFKLPRRECQDNRLGSLLVHPTVWGVWLHVSVLLKSMARPTGLMSFRLDDLRFCCSTKNDIVNVVKVARQ